MDAAMSSEETTTSAASSSPAAESPVEIFSRCDRMTRGPYETLETGELACRDEWSESAAGTPCRTLRDGGTQKITAVPLKRQFGDVLYSRERSFNDDNLLDNVFLAPLIDPYKSAQRNLTIEEAVALQSSVDCPAERTSSCSAFSDGGSRSTIPVCLKDHPSCDLKYQRKLLECANDPGSSDPGCIGGVLGATSVPDCSSHSSMDTCETTPMFCKWDDTPYLDPVTTEPRRGKCEPTNPVQVCYDVVAAESPVCSSDKNLLQYVQDARSGVLVERAERVRYEETRECNFSDKASATDYVRITTKVPHGVTKNGTKVLVQGMGKNDGLRAVFVVDERTLTYLKRPGDSEMPSAGNAARIYVPYESSEGIVEYTRGERGRPAKRDPQCVRREAFEQCTNMPNKHKRRYTMLQTSCNVKRTACTSLEDGRRGMVVDGKCLHEEGAPSDAYREVSCHQDVDCESGERCVGESVSAGKVVRGACVKRSYEPCGYERHYAGVGPDPDHGNWHFTKAETSSAKKVGSAGGCDAATTTLGTRDTVEECAQACAETLGCNFFLFGKDRCLMSAAQTKDCAAASAADNDLDMYEIVLRTNQVGCSRFGESCCPEAHVRGKKNAHVKCAFQEPDESGAFRLNLVRPGDDRSPMCIPQYVQTLKDNEQLTGDAKLEAMQFDDMKKKNSHVALQYLRMQDLRDELDNGCCKDNGICGCPYLDFPVYYAAYEDADDSVVKPMPVGVNNVIAGCDSWVDVEKEIERGNKIDPLDLTQMRDKTTFQHACREGWNKRNCDAFQKRVKILDKNTVEGSTAELRLAACLSGIQLRARDAPIHYDRHKRLMLSKMLARPFTDKMAGTCDPEKEPDAEGFCEGAGVDTRGCQSDEEGRARCQQCVTDENCAVELSSEEYVCRPVIDPKREIIYDGDLENNPYTKHGYRFKTCQRKDLYDQQKARLDKMPFADYQRAAEIRMQEAQRRSKFATIGVLVVVLVAAAAAFFLWPKKKSTQ